MSFDSYGVSQTSTSENVQKVDWDAMNKYVVETAGLQQPETLVGYVSAIVDLGIQDQDDAEMVFTGTPNDEAEAIAAKPATYFKDGVDEKGNKVRLKCWPQKAVQSVAVAVDFPDVMIDKGQFFGESNPQPLRIWMGGQFWNSTQGKMLIGRVTSLKETKKDMPDWSLSPLNLFHKMAVAAKIIQPGQVFKANRIDELLGKAFQFSVQVFFKPGKNGKSYYTENIKFAAALGRGMSEPERKTTPFLVQFNRENDVEKLKELRPHIRNTMVMATNYAGSVIERQLAELMNGNAQQQSTPTPPSHVTEQVPANAQSAGMPYEWDDFDSDSDCPF